MKQSEYFVPTLKEVPADAVIPSHVLMLRAGLVRQLASGVFSFLPLGYKVIKKIIDVVRAEMESIGAQEFLLPALNPIDIWEQTGRVESMGDVMFHIKNREGLVLAPTHEEIITFHARQHIKSYRDLPQIWYQIQNKFRNEPRPKSGVLRGRQFTMKDSYSMDISPEGLDKSYLKHRDAYIKIFERLGLRFFIVSASSGAMGGRQSEEFMVESNSGEDTCAVCDSCGYAANFEIATSSVYQVTRLEDNMLIEEFPTPDAKSIDDLIEQFSIPEDRCAKSVVYFVDSEPVLILMRGNDEMNETKLQTIFKTNQVRPAVNDELIKYFGASTGSIGPVDIPSKIKVIADNRLINANGMVSGANKNGYHLKNIDFERDCRIDAYYDLRTVGEGEPCPNCNNPLRVVKAIELGHIFKLGTKYSEALGANFLDETGCEHPIIMGSYGIGIERIMACFIEQNYDENGIIWKNNLRPFDAHLVGLNFNKNPEVKSTCDLIYQNLKSNGFDVLFDDRNDSPGVKFNDADLLGIPIQIIAGPKNLADNKVEIKFRKSGTRKLINLEEIIQEISSFYN